MDELENVSSTSESARDLVWFGEMDGMNEGEKERKKDD
jgi:hypothetical protein